MEHSKYAVDQPYPSLDGILPNAHDLNLIMGNYSGICSELTAVTQYFYHHLYTSDDIAKTLMGIAIVEMKHLNIFGEVIKKLGGDPRFLYPTFQNRNYWWCGSIVNYSKQLKPILISDIELERKTILEYQKQAKIVSQQPLKAVLNRIILDEQLHMTLLEQLQNYK